MTDIVERLRDTSKFETWEDLTGLIVEAADEIERLREIERLYTVAQSQWVQAEIALRDAEIEKLRDGGLKILALERENESLRNVSLAKDAEIERLRDELGKTERDLEKALAALDHHLKAKP